MAPARRPDSWLILSGPPTISSRPPTPSNETGNRATGNDSLPEFVSEAQPPATATPAVLVSPARDHAPVAKGVFPSAGPHLRVVRSRTLAVSPMLVAVAVAAIASSAITITLLGGFDRSSANVPPRSEAMTPNIPPASLAAPVAIDPRWGVDPVTQDRPPQIPPVVATRNRAI